MEYWNDGIVEQWILDDGVMEYWSKGIYVRF